MSIREVQLTSIANAVDQANILMTQGYPRSSVRGEMISISNHIKYVAEVMGGQTWIVRWEGEVEPMSHISIPAEWRKVDNGKIMNWPSRREGTVVEIDGIAHTVVVNRIWRKERNDVAFAIYAIIPA
jgi:hypothetical protein